MQRWLAQPLAGARRGRALLHLCTDHGWPYAVRAGRTPVTFDDYLRGRIKKHELTRPDKEEDRMKHVRAQNANVEPVFFLLPGGRRSWTASYSRCRRSTVRPESTTSRRPDGFGHRFWRDRRSGDDQRRITRRYSRRFPRSTSPTGITARPPPRGSPRRRCELTGRTQGTEEYCLFLGRHAFRTAS